MSKCLVCIDEAEHENTICDTHVLEWYKYSQAKLNQNGSYQYFREEFLKWVEMKNGRGKHFVFR